jgi:hypothetical protein
MRIATFHRQADGTALLDEHLADLAEDPGDVRFPLERGRDPGGVATLVRLRAGRPHRRAAAAVQQLELDAGRVNRPAHQAPERVDLANQMAFRRAADRRITRHVGHGVARQRAQANVTSKARGGVRCLHARMSRADDDHIEVHVCSGSSW